VEQCSIYFNGLLSFWPDWSCLRMLLRGSLPDLLQDLRHNKWTSWQFRKLQGVCY